MKSLFRNILLALVLTAGVSSCSTPTVSKSDKQIEEQPKAGRNAQDSNDVPVAASTSRPLSLGWFKQQRQQELRIVDMECDASVSFNGMLNKAQCTIGLYGRDSMGMSITGPFGINVGKLYAEKDTFVYFDGLQSRVLTGRPDSIGMSRTMLLPLSFQDLVSLMCNEPPGIGDDFVLMDSAKVRDEGVLYRRKNKASVDFIVFRSRDSVITQYQRKDQQGNNVVNVSYEDFQRRQGVLLPAKVTISSEQTKGYTIFSTSSLSLNTRIPRSLRFSIPASIPRQRVN